MSREHDSAKDELQRSERLTVIILHNAIVTKYKPPERNSKTMSRAHLHQQLKKKDVMHTMPTKTINL